jgi:hypothetical protein
MATEHSKDLMTVAGIEHRSLSGGVHIERLEVIGLDTVE